ncbi:hypothetical protein OKW98_11865 [Pseudomonas sp. KU26590]|uniref:hypothetical protein n=1 Tax=Pseudomonas sp. KU26590 TaxID=2991051 RepID=UPI00223CB151|nr:hypothetical protein [Pseudomonas sp. KU26590]UZJ62356.1 hypothetical protein OKW98_11865 [Pseudomonas sp. KU26590]
MIIESRQFHLVVSMPDLFEWSDDDVPHLLDDWVQIIDLLGFDVEKITALCDLYFDRTPIGEGNVHAFISDDQPENTMAFDLYRGQTDQLDIIGIVIRVSGDRVSQAKSLLRHAFDLASCQIQYEEGAFLHAFKEMTHVEGYPKLIKESGFRQRILNTRN